MSYKFKEITVLIVDRQPHIIALIRGVLNMFGVQKIYAASTREQALADFEEYKPELLIVDWEIANSTGIDFTRAIRQTSQNPYVPIIFMTSLTSEARVTEARDSGITEFLAKPFSVDSLYKRIERIIEKPRDFIVAPHYVGPDRRRKKGEPPEGVDERRKEEIEKKAKFVPLPQDDVFKNRARLRKATVVTPPNVIKTKVGDGGIAPENLKSAQEYVSANTVDFRPIGKALVEDLHLIIGQIKTGKLRGEAAIEAMLFPAAQLKAQGALFRYSLVSDIAEILVDFLERVEKADRDVIDVVDAHVVAVTFVLNNSMKDDGRGLDKELKNSLLKACSRYYALKEK